MVKKKSSFVCQQCGYESGKWFGKCPNCGSWGSLVETIQTQVSKAKSSRKADIKPVSLASISSKSTKRTLTKISELDRVLGGGIVAGQVTLIAGEPGIGKSTLLLQVADKLAGVGKELGTRKKKKAKDNELSNVVYVSGEESVSQIKIRADRLGIRNKNIQMLEETDIDRVILTAELLAGELLTDKNKDSSTIQQFNSSLALIIDSIQTMQTSDLSGMAGSVGQVRECAYRLVRFAKKTGAPVFIVGHITKQGSVAGPSVLMHIVDSVLWFEGDKSLTLRMLRAMKNRFGPTDEAGIFSMEDKGLVSMDNPEKIFLTSTGKNVAGSAISSTLHGTRPILAEIQSLVVPSKLAYPRRVAQGIDSKKMEVIIAVLNKRCGLPLYEHDVFANVAGGVSIKNDPSSDLAIALSIASAFFDKPLPKGTISVGEVGLLGDIRNVVAQEKRIKEARRLGYKNVISSKEVKYLGQAIKKYIRD